MSSETEPANPVRSPGSPRQPTLLDALAPVVVLIVLLALTMVLFGIDAANGPMQVERAAIGALGDIE